MVAIRVSTKAPPVRALQEIARFMGIGYFKAFASWPGVQVSESG